VQLIGDVDTTTVRQVPGYDRAHPRGFHTEVRIGRTVGMP
jgi:hypothetical protein